MARPLAQDYLHSMRFHVSVIGGADRFGIPGRPDAGFSAVSTPEATVEAVEYKEGNNIFTKKFPGNPTMSDITMSRGVARQDGKFWEWIRQIMMGTGDYREDLSIVHFHRDALPGYTTTIPENIPTTGGAKKYHIYQAFPIRHKVAADLDATASEVSIMEMDISYEYFDIETTT